MVAQLTDGTAFDRRGLPFRRRNVLPGAIAAAVLALAAVVVWSIALSRPADVHEAAACNPPPPGADGTTVNLGRQLTRSQMSGISPAKLADAKITVNNASGQPGQAADVAGALRDLGFAQPQAANDPIYGASKLTCQGQIRFGPSGQAAAAALWLVAPCTELFEDERSNDSVDLAIGTEFTTLTHSDDIDAVLAGLRPDAAEPADSALLTKVHQSC